MTAFCGMGVSGKIDIAKCRHASKYVSYHPSSFSDRYIIAPPLALPRLNRWKSESSMRDGWMCISIMNAPPFPLIALHPLKVQEWRVNDSIWLTRMERPPPSLAVALQFVNVQSVMVILPSVSVWILTAPPLIPAVQDMNVIWMSVSDALKETVKSNAPPSLLHTQDVKERLERVKELTTVADITLPPPLFFAIAVNVVFSSVSV